VPDLRLLEAEPSDAERAAIDEVLGAPPATNGHRIARDDRNSRHLLLPALRAAQRRVGWVSEGALGYATRRDLSGIARALFFALLGLIVFGIVAIFASIPHANIIYAVLGLVIFGGFTIVDFNRLRRAGTESAVPIAASIFLDIFNVFLFFLQLFGGGRER